MYNTLAMDQENRSFAGPTFEEMLHPATIRPDIRSAALDARSRDPLDPINLYNISWRDGDDRIRYEILPKELTGVEANIVVLYSVDFPTGSHKVGAAYSVAVEMEIAGDVDPAHHALVWPSTGNYGIGGAWVGCRMGFKSVVVLPEGMSRERFEQIKSYGASIIPTPGSESNVKEIYDKVRQLRTDPNVRIMNQFEVMGNYRFHYYVTGSSIVELAGELAARGIGDGTVSVFASAMGSAGTIAAGDRLKQMWPDLKIVGLEPIQCSTLYNNGYGSHDIQGIGDKHVTWIHNVMNMDAIICIDDAECLKGLELLTDETGRKVLEDRCGIPPGKVAAMSRIFGISGICNVLGAIKAARHYGLGRDATIVTICTDDVSRYRSVMRLATERFGRMDESEAAARTHIFRDQDTSWIRNGDPDQRRQWHNLKYYTWVEQQGKSVEQLDAQLDREWWLAEQARVADIDDAIRMARSDPPGA